MSRPARLRLLGAAVATVLLSACAPQEPQHVLFISLDTTRRDHLSVYGYERATTPRIAELAETSAVFEHGFAHGTTTNATHASMFTSTYPHVHGVGSNIRQFDGLEESPTPRLHKGAQREQAHGQRAVNETCGD